MFNKRQWLLGSSIVLGYGNSFICRYTSFLHIPTNYKIDMLVIVASVCLLGTCIMR